MKTVFYYHGEHERVLLTADGYIYLKNFDKVYVDKIGYIVSGRLFDADLNQLTIFVDDPIPED